MGVIIGIDIGGSTTKIVGFNAESQSKEPTLIEPIFVKATDPITSIYGAFGKFTSQNNLGLSDIEKIMITGVGASFLAQPIYGCDCEVTPEFKSIGIGGLYLSGLNEAIIGSLGTGTAFVHAKRGFEPDYLGGTGMGGGTLMDFGRYSAWKLGIPFVAIPTIVSSDGFTADICSIIIDGQKKSIPMQAADAVICDMDVVSGAPMFLSIAGVQDIMAKYVSIADWKIAHLVSGEYFCPMVCDMAQEALDIMVRCAHELAEGKEPDFEAMAYTQMLSGLTMQILSNSRAASGAEHLVAHLVEMKPRGFENAHGMHGECVGIGTIMCASAYHKLAERETIEVKPFEPVDEQWVRDVFGELADGILTENENDVLKTFAPENIKEKWPQIREIIATIPKAEELIELYTKIGAKHSLEELGIDESVREEFLDISSAIRNRLTLARMTRLIVK